MSKKEQVLIQDIIIFHFQIHFNIQQIACLTKIKTYKKIYLYNFNNAMDNNLQLFVLFSPPHAYIQWP